MSKQRLLKKESPQKQNLFFRFCFVAMLLLLGNFSSYAQQKITVTGIVKDTEKEPIIGAVIKEEGGTAGTVTDVDGLFTITLSKPNATLSVSFVGMKSKQVPVDGKNKLDIILEEQNVALDEVVVTALGIKKQAKALGYAVAEVKGDDITKGRDDNAITALSGRMAGVDISTGSGGPSGSTRVLIRGNSQLSGSNLPLYVVDGVPMDNTQLGSAGKEGGYDMGDGLSSINPSDIESISVLKGASASALYGSRASNGVVLITTKSGKGQKGLGIDVSSSVNAVTISKKFDDYQRVYGQGTSGQPPLLESSAQTSTQSAWGAKLDPNLSFPIFNGQMRPYSNVDDNILSFFRTGVTFNNSIAVSNNTDKSDMRISVSDMRNKDIVPSADMYRTTIMLKGSMKLGNKITAEARANYTKEHVNNRPALSDNPNNIGNSLIGIAPNFHQSWLKEGYKDAEGRYNSWNANKWRLNPYWVIDEMENYSNKDRLMGHVQFNYQILPYLSAQVKGGLDWYEFQFTEFAPMYTDGIESGQMRELTTSVHENNYEAMLRFNKRFNDLDVSAFVGANIMRYNLRSRDQVGIGQSIPDMVSISNYTKLKLTPNDVNKQVNSGFGAINLGYKDFVYLDATIRNDVSSSLSSNNRSYTYPSVSGSLLFSELVDLKSIGLSFGKFRASWAKVGGDTDPYMLDQVYRLMSYTINGRPLGQIGSTDVMPNRGLKPTSTYSYELGLDLRFLNNRVNLDFGYYYQTTKDQIMQLPISESSGYKNAMVNAGEIENKGIEMSLNVVPVQTKDFEWSANLNFAKNINKVIELHPEVQNYQLSEARWAGAWIYAMQGERFGSIVGKKFKRNPEGHVIYNDAGMPTFEDNLSILGNGTYDFTMGLSNTFRYKGITLGVLLDMKFGADIYSMSSLTSYSNGTSVSTLEGRAEWYASEEDRRAANKTQSEWTATGGYVGKGVVSDGAGNWIPNTTVVDPQEYWKTVTNNTPEPFIFDASYIKLRELTLSYDVPSKVLAKTPIRALSLSAFGRNLFILHSKLKNVDPESNYNNGNGQGFEYGSLPSRRTFGFGVNLKF